MGRYLDTGEYILDPGEAEKIRADSAAHARDLPQGVPTSKLRTMTDFNAPIGTDAHGRYTTSYTGEKNYINPNEQDKANTFAHTFSWNPLTGEYDSHLNGSGALGLAEGALAVAGPAVIGPMLTGSPSLFAGLGGGSAESANLAEAPGAGSTSSGVVAGSKIPEAAKMGFSVKDFLDPKTLTLAALSLLGGGSPYQTRDPYRGDLTSPENSLYGALSAAYRMGQGMSERGPVKLRAHASAPPAPISLPGIPFQIGGGLGRDPALDDPTVLNPANTPNAYDPFQSIAQGQFNKAKKGGQY